MKKSTSEKRRNQSHWLSEFQKKYNGSDWTALGRALLADPKAVEAFIALDASGHEMNVIRSDETGWLFGSASKEAPTGHRNVTYAQAVKIAEDLGVRLMDIYEYDLLAADTDIHTWVWLLTPQKNLKYGSALRGNDSGVVRYDADCHRAVGSFRAALRVERA